MVVIGLTAAPAAAHTFTITDVTAVFHPDHTYTIDVRVDVDALALGVSPALDSSIVAAELRSLSPEDVEMRVNQAKDTILHRVRVRFDGERMVSTVTFPQRGVDPAPNEPVTVLGTLARLSGTVPTGAKTFTFGASRAFGPVILTIRDPASVLGVEYQLDVSEDSPPHPLDFPQPAPARPRGRGSLAWAAVATALAVAAVAAVTWARRR
jgi:hypothetical protein